MRIEFLPASMLALVSWMFPAAAAERVITFGQPDGNRHPNVGALVANYISPQQKDVLCSGTLIAKKYFLTAAHCTASLQSIGISEVWVTFDSAFNRDTGTFYKGTLHTNPGYNWRQSDPQDLAIVELDAEINGITPASLPVLGLLDQMALKNGLKGQEFTAAGYGASNLRIGGGPASFTYPDIRKFGISTFDSLNTSWIHLSQNPSTGDTGVCYGDSGGPVFLGSIPNDTYPTSAGTIVAITVTGDAMCRATNVVYRLDTPAARTFLGQYVTLP